MPVTPQSLAPLVKIPATQVSGALLTPADRGDATRASPCSLLVRTKLTFSTLTVNAKLGITWALCHQGTVSSQMTQLPRCWLSWNSRYKRTYYWCQQGAGMFAFMVFIWQCLVYVLSKQRLSLFLPLSCTLCRMVGSAWKVVPMPALASAKHRERNRTKPTATGSAR